MHMADALISTAVGGGFWVLSTGVGVKASKKIQDQIEDSRIPLMGVMGAFVFAAQMINFTIPGTGSSGHIGGGMLLAALLGPYAAFITLAAVLLIQALFFGDGGLLAYGCNLFNMGFFTCFVAYPLIFKPLLSKQVNKTRMIAVSILSVVVGLQLGAFGVVLETFFSGKTELPFGAFVAMMQPIHLAIGLVEGMVTAAIVTFIWQARPELLQVGSTVQKSVKKPLKPIILGMLVLTLVTGGFVSLVASANPDGLEWALIHVTGSAELESDSKVHETAGAIQEKTAVLPDYGFKNGNESNALLGTSVSGFIGSGVTLGAVICFGALARRKKKMMANSAHE